MGEWDRLSLFEARGSPELVGKSFDEIGRERGQHPLDAIMDILLEAGDDAPNVLFVGLVQTQEDLDLAFASATCSPESDATTLSPDGPLARQRFLGAYTWASFYLRCIVRERSILGLEEAVRRLTRMPAERVGIADRGILAAGAWADITVFDPDRVEDRGTLSDPNAFPTGIRHVVVNGRPALVDGRFSTERSGVVLRRPGRGVAP
jgi:N-acyl-D-amino-acid deacylase